MDNSIYIALSRQMTMFRDMEVTSNNIANVNTTGYQAEKLLFQDFLVPDGQKFNSKMAFARDPISYRDDSEGRMKTTGNTFDLAISGSGYFKVETPLGERYTRAGNFTLDAEGTLVTMEGYPVLSPDGGTITLPDAVNDITINGAGEITGGGDELGTIGIVEFENPQELERVGSAMFKSNQEPDPAVASNVMQGALEMSNVNGVGELVRVTQLSRSVGNTAKFVEVMYDLQRKTSTTYGRPAQG
ncbi:MAG: flagellar basal-body rod protein FlgF [Alphaproteobacteria bacterium]|nr:flagellar basal-body rod protein FlgF [Alphaproteobacteria bacterium]